MCIYIYIYATYATYEYLSIVTCISVSQRRPGPRLYHLIHMFMLQYIEKGLNVISIMSQYHNWRKYHKTCVLLFELNNSATTIHYCQYIKNYILLSIILSTVVIWIISDHDGSCSQCYFYHWFFKHRPYKSCPLILLIVLVSPLCT